MTRTFAPKTKKSRVGRHVGTAIILVVMIGLALAVDASLVSRSLSLAGKSKLSSPSPSSRSAQQKEVWKTYSDQELGFSIEYPASWYLDQNSDFQQPKAVSDVLEVREMFANFPPPFLGSAEQIPAGCRFDVLVALTAQQPRQLLSSKAYAQVGGASSPTTEEAVSVNSVQGVKRVYAPDNRAATEKRTIVLLPTAGKLWALYYRAAPEMEAACSSAFDKMISSFTVRSLARTN